MELDGLLDEQPCLLGQQVSRVAFHACAGTVALVFAVATCHAQTFYKWKDASGATHYSDSPPATGSATKVAVRAGVSAEAGKIDRPAPAASAPAPASPSPELLEAEARYQKQSCEAARRDVAAVQSGAMLVDNGDPSQAKRLDESQRQDALAAAQDRVKQYCGTGADKP